MNSAELKKVNSGDKFAPKAPDWNAFVDAAMANRATWSDQTSGRLLRTSQNGIVPVRNDTGADQDQFVAVTLDTLLITPTDNEDEFRHRPPVFSGTVINLAKPFAVLQEPLKQGFIGKAMIAGVTPAKFAISDESHGFAELAESGLVSASSGIARILWKESGTGTKWTIIYFPAGGGGSGYDGPFALVKTDSTHLKVRGHTSDGATDRDSPLLIDTGSYCYTILVNEITLEANRTLPYICLDWWWDISTSAWIHAIVASASLYPVAGDYVSYPAEMERVSRRIIGKEKWSYGNSTWTFDKVEQWLQGAVTAQTRAY